MRGSSDTRTAKRTATRTRRERKIPHMFPAASFPLSDARVKHCGPNVVLTGRVRGRNVNVGRGHFALENGRGRRTNLRHEVGKFLFPPAPPKNFTGLVKPCGGSRFGKPREAGVGGFKTQRPAPPAIEIGGGDERPRVPTPLATVRTHRRGRGTHRLSQCQLVRNHYENRIEKNRIEKESEMTTTEFLWRINFQIYSGKNSGGGM